MILIDSAVWAEWLNGTSSAHVQRLERAMGSNEPLALTPLILTEVLQGIRDDRSFDAVRNTLGKFPMFDLDRQGHIEAAKLFRRRRKAGLTVRGTIDVLIAQTCLERNCPILSPDRDFAAIAKHSALRLCAI